MTDEAAPPAPAPDGPRTVDDLLQMMQDLQEAGYGGSLVLLASDEEGNDFGHLDSGVTEVMVGSSPAVVIWPSGPAEPSFHRPVM